MSGMKCFTDVETLLKQNASDDDIIDIYCYRDTKSSKIAILEFNFVVDPVIPISQKQLTFIAQNCDQKSHIQKCRKDLTKEEHELILKCQYINPSHFE